MPFSFSWYNLVSSDCWESWLRVLVKGSSKIPFHLTKLRYCHSDTEVQEAWGVLWCGFFLGGGGGGEGAGWLFGGGVCFFLNKHTHPSRRVIILQVKTEILNWNLAEIVHRAHFRRKMNLHLWRFSNPTEQCPEEPALDDPALNKGVRLDDVQRCLPVSAILWLCEDEGGTQTGKRSILRHTILSK